MKNQFMGKVPHKQEPERMQIEQIINEFNKPFRLIDVLNDKTRIQK